jgi:glycosyltransferase involved in cell wall biosynthesis
VRVGVVVPVHGWAPYLAEALDAILAQQPAPVALVVVDDGSREPLALHPDHAPHAMLVRREARGGVAAARATGEAALEPGIDLVASCDADDAWLAGKLAAQVEELASHPPAAMCFGAAIVVGADGRATGERWDVPAAPLTAAALYVHNPIPVSSAVVRRDALRAAGGYGGGRFPQYAEDWDLWLRMLRTGASFAGVEQPCLRYRRHPGGMTADVGALARAQLALHREHGDLVDAATRRRALARDRRALVRDRVRGAVRRAI